MVTLEPVSRTVRIDSPVSGKVIAVAINFESPSGQDVPRTLSGELNEDQDDLQSLL